jgi:fluoride exporter
MPWRVLAVISVGGVLGALARYGIIVAFPEPAAAFVWPVFWINVVGCLLIGIVIVLATEIRKVPRLVRPFLATGVLGGFTTFSTYITGMQHELAAGAPRTALFYGAATVIVALAAAWCGISATTAAVGWARAALPIDPDIEEAEEGGQ